MKSYINKYALGFLGGKVCYRVSPTTPFQFFVELIKTCHSRYHNMLHNERLTILFGDQDLVQHFTSLQEIIVNCGIVVTRNVEVFVN